MPVILERNNDVNRRNVYGKCHLIRLITLLLVRTIKSKYLRKSTTPNSFKCAIREVIDRRIMKLRTPFTVFPNPLRDFDYIHDFSYQLPEEKKSLFWEKECKLHPTKSTCKLYDV